MNQDQAELEAAITGASDYARLEHYNGEVVLEYSPSLHAYTIVEDGVRFLVPGTTTVVGMIDKSGALTQWAANMTVQWFLENFPDAGARETLAANYQHFKGKLPWEDGAEGTYSYVVKAETKDIAKLLNESRFNYRQISKDACDVGHMAHEWLERYIKAMLPGAITDCMVRPLPAEKRAASCVEAALAWFAKHKFEPIFSEKKLYSRRYGYAGTCDWLAYVTSCGDPECCPFLGEALVLGDFKSSNNLYDEYFCQLASYRQAIEEEWPELQIGACTLLRLGKEDGEFEVRTSTQEEFDSDFDGFLGCLSMYHWQKQRSLNKRYERETAKAEAKAAKAEALAQEKEEKARIKAEAKAEKDRLKDEAKAAKEAAREAAGKAPRKAPKRAVVREAPSSSIPIDIEEPVKKQKKQTTIPIEIEIEAA